MVGHSLYNLIKDKLSANTQNKLERQMEYNDAQRLKHKYQ